MFGRATITLGIGPHSSSLIIFIHRNIKPVANKRKKGKENLNLTKEIHIHIICSNNNNVTTSKVSADLYSAV